MNRKPIACPEYYPNTFEKLDRSIRESFRHKKGQGTLQAQRRNVKNDLFLVPSETIKKAGPCTAWGYMEIAEAKFPKTYLIIGTNHHSNTKYSTYLFANWETPLGIVKINEDMGKALQDVLPQLVNEHTAHENEHSIEIQLPWLQFAARDKLQDLSFIPLTINTKEIKDIKKLAEVLNKFTEENNIPIIASYNVEDTATIRYIKSGNSEALLNYKQRRRKDLKELAPLLTLIEISNLRKKKGEVINFQTSASEENKREHYACINFK